MSSTWLSSRRATSPSATRAAVSRALARSRTGRASSKPYFCIPVRSACPGRGRVSGAVLAWPPTSPDATGEFHLVLLERHPRAATVTGPSSGQRHGDVLGADPHSGGHALADRDQRTAVRFTCGQPRSEERRVGK